MFESIPGSSRPGCAVAALFFFVFFVGFVAGLMFSVFFGVVQ